MKKFYDESQNLSNEEMLEELSEYDPEWTAEKKEDLSDLEEDRKEDEEIGSPHKDEFEKDRYRHRREISEKWFERNLDLLREQGEGRLADEFDKRMENLDEIGKKEWREKKEAEEKGEMHIGPEKGIGRRKEEIERQVGDALVGITPDEKTTILEDFEEITEFHEGKDYLDKRRDEELEKRTFEENEENLEKSDMGWEKKQNWKVRNRKKYGK